MTPPGRGERRKRSGAEDDRIRDHDGGSAPDLRSGAADDHDGDAPGTVEALLAEVSGEPDPPTEDPRTLPVLTRPGWVIGTVGVLLALLVGAFLAGRWVSGPDDAAREAAEQPIPVMVAVELRPEVPALTLIGEVTAAQTQAVTVPAFESAAPAVSNPDPGTGNSAAGSAPEPAQTEKPVPAPSPGSTPAPAPTPTAPAPIQRSIVTLSSLSVDDRPAPGALLGEVSGLPVIAVPTGTALYRDLVVGTVGPDVLSIKQLLRELGYWGISDGNTFDQDSLDAATRLFAEYGYPAPLAQDGRPGLTWQRLLPLPAGADAVTRVAGVGTVLDDETPLVTFATSDASIAVLASLLERERLEIGSAVNVLIAGVTHESTVTAIGAYAEGTDGKAGGYPVSIAFPSAAGAIPSAGTPVPVTIPESGDLGPSVPLIAVRQDGSGASVQLVGETGTSAPAMTEPGDAAAEQELGERISVTVIGQDGGWIRLAPDDRLPEGTALYVW